MQKLMLIYEGKAKRVFSTDNPDFAIIEYKDDATAFDGKKRGVIENKGIVNNKLSNHFFMLLEANGISTHFMMQLSDRETLVKSVSIIPIEVVIRNKVAGSLSKRLGLVEGSHLSSPVIEFYLKSDVLGDPMINEYHIDALQLATPEEIGEIKSIAFRVNDILKTHLFTFDIELIDFKLEFGRCNLEIILADEISPDTCRFWDVKTQKKLDKDRFRRDLGEVSEVYHEVLNRVVKHTE